jgi:hypothetical protein
MAKPLVHFGFNYPGFFGLNTQQEDEALDPRWATTATNMVFDSNSRLAARKGTRNVNASAVTNTPTIKSMHEYIDSNGNKLFIFAADNKIWKLVGDATTDISGSITTPTADNWQFKNFNGWCVAFQAGHDPIVITAVGNNFADSGGTQHQGAMVESAGGRLWTETGNTLYYSDLLTNNFTGGSSGNFDLASFWKGGMDEVVAISEFNGFLVVFGRDNIIVYSEAASTATLVENIAGIGCVARDSLQQIGNDIIFLSSKGVVALSRVIQEKSTPERDVSRNVRDFLLGYVNAADGPNIKSVYNRKEGIYLLSIPTSNITFHFNVTNALQDGSFRITTWEGCMTSLLTTQDDTLYLGCSNGFIRTYGGYLDNVASDGTGGVGYSVDYLGTWNDFNQEVANLEKLPKRASLQLDGGFGTLITFKWLFDFDESVTFSKTLTLVDGQWDEFGTAEFGVAEFGTGVFNRQIKIPLRGSGRVIKAGVIFTTTGSEVGIQRIDVQAKLGKLRL